MDTFSRERPCPVTLQAQHVGSNRVSDRVLSSSVRRSSMRTTSLAQPASVSLAQNASRTPSDPELHIRSSLYYSFRAGRLRSVIMFFDSLTLLSLLSLLDFYSHPRRPVAVMLRKRAVLASTVLSVIVLYYSLRFMPSGEAKVHQIPLKEVKNITTSAKPFFALPLRTAGRQIVDANGERVKLASINWYGASDIYFVPGELDFRHRDEIAATIKKMGFNSVRFPYSDQMVIENPVIAPEFLSANLDLLDEYDLGHNDGLKRSADELDGPRALDVYNACVKSMTDAGLIVIPNDHITNAHWCDGMNLCDSSWKNDQYGPICKIKQTTESWIDHWKTIMRPFISNSLVIGADLRNEPRGIWGTMSWKSWAEAAEKASEALLTLNSDWLMFVEGVSSANDCSGVRERPVKLSIPDRVVYSSHVYSWSGWGHIPSVPYGKRPNPSFQEDMMNNWAFLLEDNIAPVWVGEFGAPHHADEQSLHYWKNLMTILRETDADLGYWALNPRKPEGYDNETYGLLRDDWETVIEDYRIKDLRELMKPLR